MQQRVDYQNEKNLSPHRRQMIFDYFGRNLMEITTQHFKYRKEYHDFHNLIYSPVIFRSTKYFSKVYNLYVYPIETGTSDYDDHSCVYDPEEFYLN